MPAEARVREVRLAAPSAADAGGGRVTLGPRAIRELGVRLGDAVVVEARIAPEGGGGDGPDAADARAWTFLATATPAPTQASRLAAGAAALADDVALLDPTVRLGARAHAALPPETSARPLAGVVRALDAPPTPCARLDVRAPAFEDLPDGEDRLRRLLAHLVLAPGAVVHLAPPPRAPKRRPGEDRRDDRDDDDDERAGSDAARSPAAVDVVAADPPAACLRVTPATRVVLTRAAGREAPDESRRRSSDPHPHPDPPSPSPSPSPSSPSAKKVAPTTPTPRAESLLAGCSETLAALREAIVWPTAHAALASALGATFPRGVLLHGPPGTGKTAAVAAVAREAGAAVTALSAGDVFGPYAGDSEAKLRDAFRKAEEDARRTGKPAVILLDEIDAMCPARGRDAGLHGSRVVAQLLTLMDDGGEEEDRHDEEEDRFFFEEASSSFGSRSDGASDASGSLRVRASRPPRPTVVATTNRPNALDPALRRPGRFDVEIETALPTAERRADILRLHARSLALAPDVRLDEVARRAKGYSGADLAGLCREAAMAAIRAAAAAAKRASIADERPRSNDPDRTTPRDSEPDSADARLVVSLVDFESALARVSASVVRGVAAEKELPRVSWDDVGGLEETKRRLRQATEWPIKFESAFARLGLAPPRGVLLYGPPGCAKTTLAIVAARASGATVVRLAAADVFSKYVGEGERVLRDAFARARKAAPAVLLLDEIDGMVGGRGGDPEASGGNGVGARLLSVMLTEMDGLEPAGAAVSVLATTNRPEALDAALTRPGRLDPSLYVPPPDARGRLEALRVHASRTPLAGDVDLEEIARRTERFTGAELAGVIREAALSALREDEGAREVAKRHVDAAVRGANASLTEEDLRRWEAFAKR